MSDPTATAIAAEAGLTADGLTALLRAEGHEVTVTALVVEPVGTGQMGTSLTGRSPPWTGRR